MNFKAGDVIIFNTDGSWWDRFIMKVSKPSTHTAMFIGSNIYSEAAKHGVVLTKHDFKCAPFRAYRMPKRYQDNIVTMLEIVEFHTGDKYSVSQAMLAGILRLFGLAFYVDKLKVDRNWFCSEWTAYLMRFGLQVGMFRNVGVNSLVPQDIERAVINDGWQRIK